MRSLLKEQLQGRLENSNTFNSVKYYLNSIDLELGFIKLERLERLIKEFNFLQIIYDYDIKVLHIITGVLEEESEFEICALIRDAINNYNKTTGKNLKTRWD